MSYLHRFQALCLFQVHWVYVLDQCSDIDKVANETQVQNVVNLVGRFMICAEKDNLIIK